MPLYEFRNDKGEHRDIYFMVKDAPAVGKWIDTRDGRWQRIFSVPANRAAIEDAWRNGLRSDAAGVHPSQVNELRAKCRVHGCGTTVNADGSLTFHSKAQRAKHLKWRGFTDMSNRG